MQKQGSLFPVDKALIIYILITSIIMVFGVINGQENITIHFLARIVVILFIFTLTYLDKKPAGSNNLYKIIRNFYPLALLPSIYKETGYLNNTFFDYFDPFFVDLEFQLWHTQPSLMFSELFPQQWFSELVHLGYFSFYFLIFGLIIFLYQKDKAKGIRVLALIMISFLLYYLIFIIFPVEGPLFYFSPEELNMNGHGFFYSLVHLAQDIGETQTAAFPSSHVGMSLIILYLSYKYARQLFPVILVLCLLLWPATVYIKAHYLVDVIGGFVSAPIILAAAVWTEKKLST